jgi:hypothetical protein
MILQRDDVNPLDNWSVRRIEDWLLDGLRLYHEIGISADGFYPLSFVNLFDSPTSGLEETFTLLAAKSQTRFRLAISRALVRSLPSHLDLEAMNTQARIRMIYSLINLAYRVHSYESVEAIDAHVAGSGIYFNDGIVPREMYGKCLEILARMAISATAAPPDRRESLKRALYKLVLHELFDDNQAPILFAGLVSVSPKEFPGHLNLLGRAFSNLHKNQPVEREMAFLSANRIAESAPDLLSTNSFQKLVFDNEDARDHWFVSALVDENGPLRLERVADTNRPILYFRKYAHRKTSITHPHWSLFESQSYSEVVGRLPKPSKSIFGPIVRQNAP